MVFNDPAIVQFSPFLNLHSLITCILEVGLSSHWTMLYHQSWEVIILQCQSVKLPCDGTGSPLAQLQRLTFLHCIYLN